VSEDVPLPPHGGVLQGAVVRLAGALGHPGFDLGDGSVEELVDRVRGIVRVSDAGNMRR
jgi:hypothetical protein